MSIWPLAILCVITQVIPPAYTEKMFQAALENDSTAPNYILVTIQDANTKKSQEVCILAPFLKGGIHREYGIAYDEAGRQKVQDYILSQKDRIYVFSKPDALKNVQPRYTDAQLGQVRDRLKAIKSKDITRGLIEGIRSEFISEKPSDRHAVEAYRDALACVLLERGILCGQGDITDFIYLGTPGSP